MFLCQISYFPNRKMLKRDFSETHRFCGQILYSRISDLSLCLTNPLHCAEIFPAAERMWEERGGRGEENIKTSCVCFSYFYGVFFISRQIQMGAFQFLVLMFTSPQCCPFSLLSHSCCLHRTVNTSSQRCCSADSCSLSIIVVTTFF